MLEKLRVLRVRQRLTKKQSERFRQSLAVKMIKSDESDQQSEKQPDEEITVKQELSDSDIQLDDQQIRKILVNNGVEVEEAFNPHLEMQKTQDADPF